MYIKSPSCDYFGTCYFSSFQPNANNNHYYCKVRILKSDHKSGWKHFLIVITLTRHHCSQVMFNMLSRQFKVTVLFTDKTSEQQKNSSKENLKFLALWRHQTILWWLEAFEVLERFRAFFYVFADNRRRWERRGWKEGQRLQERSIAKGHLWKFVYKINIQ